MDRNFRITASLRVCVCGGVLIIVLESYCCLQFPVLMAARYDTGKFACKSTLPFSCIEDHTRDGHHHTRAHSCRAFFSLPFSDTLVLVPACSFLLSPCSRHSTQAQSVTCIFCSHSTSTCSHTHIAHGRCE